MNPDFDHGLSGHPGGVELVAAILPPEPDQNQPEVDVMIFKIFSAKNSAKNWRI
jgi:hypothetical protein